MKRLLACALALTLCLTLTACWEAESAEPQGFWELEEPPMEESPIAEDTKPLVFTLPYLNSQTLDPIACSDGVQQVVGSLLYEGLFELDEAFQPQNLLCASYSVSGNGLSYTFRLREDVSFSNGDVLTASDVLATYRRAQASERYAARFANVASMGTYRGTLVIALREPNSAFPALLDIPVVKSGTEKDAVPLGTGPYVFLTDSEGPCLARKEHWWRGADSLPERIALMPAKDADTAVYLFSAENVHLLTADLLGETSAAALSGVACTDAATSVLLFLGFNTRRGPLADASARAAMGGAFDRNAIVETLLAGHARAARFPISPASPLYPDALDSTATDDGAYAISLSNDADESAAQPLELTLLVNAENSFKVALAEHLAKQLAAAQLAVTPVVLPWAEYLTALQGGEFDLWLGEVRLTADWDVSPLIAANGSLNYGGFSSATLDKALSDFLKEESPATAAAFCEHFAEESPILPLVFKSVSVLTPEGLIDGVAPTATQPLRDLERWTFRFGS